MPIISLNFPVQESTNLWFGGLLTHLWRACDPCGGLLSGGLVTGGLVAGPPQITPHDSPGP